MKVLVTGNTGYIGTVMARVLAEAGHEVVGLDSGFFEDCLLMESDAAFHWIRKDVRDVTVEDLKGFDAVAHLAALSNDPMGELDPAWTRDINYRASVELARKSRDAGVRRFLFSSSCSMYGAAGEDLLTEEAPLRPLTAYAKSKVRTEEDLLGLADGDFSPVFMRNATAYGLSPRWRADLVLNNLVGWAVTAGEIRLMTDGTPWRPLAHVEDIARAFAAALEAPRDVIHGQAFNVGATGENYQVRDLAEFVREVMPHCRVTFADGAGPDPRNYRVSFDKIARALPAFRPRWTARAGVEQIYEALRRANLQKDDFFGRKYIRLNQLKHLISEKRLDAQLRWVQEPLQTNSEQTN
jgi:nucleoside-diphosphate-sugar epimerase